MFEIPTTSIPVSVFLIPFGFFLVFYILYAIFNFYHLVRYGIYGFGLYLIATIFAGGTLILLAISGTLLLEYNWDAPISLNAAISGYNDALFPDSSL